jgi:hypothetical protein
MSEPTITEKLACPGCGRTWKEDADDVKCGVVVCLKCQGVYRFQRVDAFRITRETSE